MRAQPPPGLLPSGEVKYKYLLCIVKAYFGANFPSTYIVGDVLDCHVMRMRPKDYEYDYMPTRIMGSHILGRPVTNVLGH
jgi:hypothetical protein